jgi:hypothetical protein
VPIVLVGTKELYNLFMNSRMTEDARAQISSRVAMHYLLSELSLAEAKAILKRGLGEDATDEAIAQIYVLGRDESQVIETTSSFTDFTSHSPCPFGS